VARELLGVERLGAHAADTLSGGQRSACDRRALRSVRNWFLADEPVASLDPEAAEEIMRLFGSSGSKAAWRCCACCISRARPTLFACVC